MEGFHAGICCEWLLRVNLRLGLWLKCWVKVISKAFECYKPDGAFYLFPSLKKYLGKKAKDGKIINNSVEFCTELLESKNIAVVPGSAFGNDNYFRISYALSLEKIENACNKIVDFCSELS